MYKNTSTEEALRVWGWVPPPPWTSRERKGSWIGVGVGVGRRQERKETLGGKMREEKKVPGFLSSLFPPSLWHEKTMAFLRHRADKAALKKTNGHD